VTLLSQMSDMQLQLSGRPLITQSHTLMPYFVHFPSLREKAGIWKRHSACLSASWPNLTKLDMSICHYMPSQRHTQIPTTNNISQTREVVRWEGRYVMSFKWHTAIDLGKICDVYLCNSYERKVKTWPPCENFPSIWVWWPKLINVLEYSLHAAESFLRS
jgi:hypothetical protein